MIGGGNEFAEMVPEEESIGDAEAEMERGIPHKPHVLRAAGEILHYQKSNALTSETESASDVPIFVGS